MRITLVISSLGAGGAERVISELASYWVSKHQVTPVTLSASNTRSFYPLDSKIHLVQLNQSQFETSLLTRFRNICRRVFCLRKTLETIKPDVVISFVDIMNLTTLLASIGLKIPVIVSERIDPHFHSIPSLYKKIRPFLYRFAHRIIVQTKSAASYFGNHLQGIIQIIPNSVKSVQAHKIFTSTAHSIITVGRLDKQKDHTTLIHAFSRLHSNYPNLHLTIYGEGAERENLQILINSLKLQEKVSLPGTIQDIHQKLAAADLFVFPSLYEGFPNALCEAMSIGLSVIASNCSGNIDIVQDSIDGCLFPVGDIQKLTVLIEELIHDPNQRKRLGLAAQNISKCFHPERVFHMWDEVIFEAMRQRA